MEHLWLELAQTMIERRPSLFSDQCDAKNLAQAMSDAWGDDRVASVWTVEDVMAAAEYLEVDEITAQDAVIILHRLQDDLNEYAGLDALEKIIDEAL